MVKIRMTGLKVDDRRDKKTDPQREGLPWGGSRRELVNDYPNPYIYGIGGVGTSSYGVSV